MTRSLCRCDFQLWCSEPTFVLLVRRCIGLGMSRSSPNPGAIAAIDASGPVEAKLSRRCRAWLGAAARLGSDDGGAAGAAAAAECFGGFTNVDPSVGSSCGGAGEASLLTGPVAPNEVV